MARRTARRSDAAWIDALRRRDDGAAEELAGVLRRALAKVLGRRAAVSDDDLADFTQDALVRIVEGLDGYRGDSAFTTWAIAVATRAAFTALRRRSVRERGRRAFDDAWDEALALRASTTPPPDADAERAGLLQALQRAIATALTDRQRVAVLAELRGLPTVEIAERLDTNRNALYKLHHDARRKLRATLLAEGFTPEDIRRHVMETSGR